MDNGRKVIKRTYEFDGGQVDFAAALTDAAALITDLEGASDLEVLGYSVAENFAEEGEDIAGILSIMRWVVLSEAKILDSSLRIDD